MITYKWEYLDLYAKDDVLIGVRYLLTGTEGSNSVSTEGNHTFADGTVNKTLADIVESDILQWLEKDITNDGVKLIKLGIENQIKLLENVKKVDFPWLAETFTI